MIEISPTFVIRTTNTPYTVLADFHKSADYIEKLTDFYNDKKIQNSLFIASPVLYYQLMKWLKLSKKEKPSQQKIILSLYKYLIRMTSRCTPFGLFAGVALGEFNSEINKEILHVGNRHKVQANLDMGLICKLADFVEREESIKESLTYFPNDSIYFINDEIRYYSYSLSNGSRQYHLNSITNSEYISLIIEEARQGKTIQEFIEILTNYEVGETDARSFIDGLIEERILISNLAPSLTGADYFTYLGKTLEKSKFYATVNKVSNALDQISSNPRKVINSINSIKEQLESSNLEPGKNLININLFLKGTFTIPAKDRDLLEKSLNQIIHVLPVTHTNNHLNEFKEAFVKRYEQAEIALVKVIDSESGLGYPIHNIGSSYYFLRNIDFPYESNQPNHSQRSTSFEDYILKKYITARETGSRVINIHPNEILRLGDEDPYSRLPTSGSVLLSAFRINNNIQYELRTVVGPSAANISARFCNGNKDISSAVSKEIEFEERSSPDQIFAEIVHLPQNRAGNILFRPQFRKYEIPILTKPSSLETIPLADLMISVNNNKVRLRSKALNKEVIPRLSTAHNFNQNPLPIYRFLCDLQNENVGRYSQFFWPKCLHACHFFPRIIFQNLILARAAWTVDCKALLNSLDDDLKLIDFLEKHKIPNQIAIIDQDNSLPLDLNNKYSKELIKEIIAKTNTSTIQLCELLEDEKNRIVSDFRSKSYCNEIIVSIRNLKPQSSIGTDLDDHHPNDSEERSFSLGSDWLYLKIYTGVRSADLLLTTSIYDIISEERRKSRIEKWFFIRYIDEEGFHLRLRFKGKDSFYQYLIERINHCLNPLVDNGLISSLKYDKYYRELERYYPKNIENSESLFYIDSECILDVLQVLDPGEEGEQIKWRIAARLIDEMLSCFNLTVNDKRELLKNMSDSFRNEFNIESNKLFKKQLSHRFRMDQRELLNDLEASFPTSFKVLKNTFEKRNKSLRLIATNITTVINSPQAIKKVLFSYVHMTMNRLIQYNSRAHELILYDYLYRYYESKMKREKYSNEVR